MTQMGRLADFINRHRFAWLLFLLIAGVGADQASKTWVQQHLTLKVDQMLPKMQEGQLVLRAEPQYLPMREITIIPDVFNLIYRENPAAAFSLTHSIPTSIRRPLLLILPLLALLLFAIWYLRSKDGALFLTCLGLVMAGALGNLIDRAALGYVIDFLDVYAGFINPNWPHFATFNIADSCVVVGTLGIVVSGGFSKRERAGHGQ